jgi:hypothetical protein
MGDQYHAGCGGNGEGANCQQLNASYPLIRRQIGATVVHDIHRRTWQAAIDRAVDPEVYLKMLLDHRLC